MNRGEIDVLKLAGWCKDLPQQRPVQQAQYMYGETLAQMVCGGYLRESKCGLSWRLTQKGYEILDRAGISYRKDRQYLGKGAALTRRLELAGLMLFLYCMGADVFTESPPQQRHGGNAGDSDSSPALPQQRQTEHHPCSDIPAGPSQQRPGISFLPSFALRRAKGSNILGGTRLAGFLYAPQTTFVPYHISEHAGIYPHIERMAFSADYLSGRKPPIVLYTGSGDLPGLLRTLTAAAEVKFKTGAVNCHDAMPMFACPVCLVPLSVEGMRQLRILCLPNWRQRFAGAFLTRDGYADSEYTCFDGVNKKLGEPFLAGADMDLGGFSRAIELVGKQKLHIAVLDFQFETAREYLESKRLHAALYAVNLAAVETALGIPALPGPDFSPYITKEGGTVNVTDFKAPGKV
jgi:hypothetical protein